MMQSIDLLERSISQHIGLLRVVLASARSAKESALRLEPGIANAAVGPYERTEWIDQSMKNLPKDGWVRFTKYDQRRNWLEVHDGQEWLRFAPFFGKLLSCDERYEIHAKGREIETNQPLQLKLIGDDIERSMPPESQRFAYALRTYRSVPSGSPVPELHLILGAKPERGGGIGRAHIKWCDRYIVRLDEDTSPVEQPYVVPFDPEGVR